MNKQILKGLLQPFLYGLLAAVSLTPRAQAQELRTTQLRDGVYMISGAGGNVTVSIGSDGIMLVDAGTAASSEELLARIRELSDKPLLYIISTSADSEHAGGNPLVRLAGRTFTGGNAVAVADVDVGAAVFAHENALLKMVADGEIAAEGWPTDTFFVQANDLYFNNEPVVMTYQGAAVDDTNIVVHFRRSDVISTGDVFRLDTYPYIDLASGGSINGVLDALNFLIELAVSDKLAEGGTLLIPGHGRVSDEGDLVRYRDMLTIIRDRVQALIERGQTLAQVKAARPSLEYDTRYGGEGTNWTTEQFIAAVYCSLGGSAD